MSGEIPAAHPWKCEQDHRLDAIDHRLDDHSNRIKVTENQLSEGNSKFIRLEMKLESVSDKLGELSDTIKGAVRWVLGIAGTAAIGGILWSMKQALP